MAAGVTTNVPSQQQQAAQLEERLLDQQIDRIRRRLRFALNRERGLRVEIAALKNETRFLHGLLIAAGVDIPEPLNNGRDAA